MSAVHGRRLACLWVAGVLTGCGGNPDPQAGTGAKEAAQAYCEALIHKDWQSGYALLDPASKKRFSRQRFEQLAQNYQRGLGFEPQAVIVRLCEEHGDEAVAHVVLTGQTAAKMRRYKDAVVLRRTDNAWSATLPADFGQRSP